MMKINVQKTLMHSWIIFKARILETKTNKENLIDVYKIHTLAFVSAFKIHPPNVLSPVHIIVRSQLRAIHQGHCDHWSVSAPHCDHSNFLRKSNRTNPIGRANFIPPLLPPCFLPPGLLIPIPTRPFRLSRPLFPERIRSLLQRQVTGPWN